MTNDEIRIAIAIDQGWTFHPEHDVSFQTPAGNVYPEHWTNADDFQYFEQFPFPNYPEDLNAMHAAWLTLTDAQKQMFYHYLSMMMGKCAGGMCGALKRHMVVGFEAVQGCECYLRVKGLWK